MLNTLATLRSIRNRDELKNPLLNVLEKKEEKYPSDLVESRR